MCRNFSLIPEESRQLERSRRTMKDNINMDLQEIMCEGVDWIKLALDRIQWWVVLKTVMNLRIP